MGTRTATHPASSPYITKGWPIPLVLLVGLGACDRLRPREATGMKPKARAVVVEPKPISAPVQTEAKRSRGLPAQAETPAATLPLTTPPETLSPAQRRRYTTALEDGRRQHRAEDYAEAVKSFERALDVAPGDPRALSELGWAAFFAEDFERAQVALREALARARGDTLIASIHYNLGRVAEAQGDKEAAVAAYEASLRLRPHAGVYRRMLRARGSVDRYAFGPQVRELQGPYPSLSRFCAEEKLLSRAERKLDGATFICHRNATEGLAPDVITVPNARALASTSPPLVELRFLETRPTPYTVRFHVAMQTDQGWFVLPDVARVGLGLEHVEEHPTRLAVRQRDIVPGSPAELSVEVETSWSEVHPTANEIELETHRVEFLCGIGPSKRPSCTGALPRAMHSARKVRRPRAERRGLKHTGLYETHWSVELRALPGGEVELAGNANAMGEVAASVLGRHPIEFL